MGDVIRNQEWLSNRLGNPHQFMQDEILTDVRIRVQDKVDFHAHKLILVSHSEYFLRMLTR